MSSVEKANDMQRVQKDVRYTVISNNITGHYQTQALRKKQSRHLKLHTTSFLFIVAREQSSKQIE